MSALSSAVEEQIAQWREYLRRRAAIHGTDVAELEDHLRSQVATLTAPVYGAWAAIVVVGDLVVG